MKAADLSPGNGKAQGEGGPPRDIEPSKLVSMLLNRGRPQFERVPFPRYDEDGKPVCEVMIRLLTVTEEDAALANARRYVAETLRTKADDLPWRPEELETNARILEILAIACRDPDNPEQPFFGHGVYEARKFFNSDELGVLANAYARLKTSQHPILRDMTEEEIDAWVEMLAEGFNAFPFVSLSRAQMETLCESLARRLVELQGLLTSQTPTSSYTSG